DALDELKLNAVDAGNGHKHAVFSLPDKAVGTLEIGRQHGRRSHAGDHFDQTIELFGQRLEGFFRHCVVPFPQKNSTVRYGSVTPTGDFQAVQFSLRRWLSQHAKLLQRGAEPLYSARLWRAGGAPVLSAFGEFFMFVTPAYAQAGAGAPDVFV